MLNRANARLTEFEDDGDFAAFERIVADAVTWYAMRLLAYCVIPNHFHLLLWPRGDGDISRFMQWLTLTHTQRWSSIAIPPVEVTFTRVVSNLSLCSPTTIS
jgi:putative transposase